MPPRIDEKATVPLVWLLIAVGILASVGASAVPGVFWVASVNSRLGRIEDKLGIKPYAGPARSPLGAPGVAEAAPR